MATVADLFRGEQSTSYGQKTPFQSMSWTPQEKGSRAAYQQIISSLGTPYGNDEHPQVVGENDVGFARWMLSQMDKYGVSNEAQLPQSVQTQIASHWNQSGNPATALLNSPALWIAVGGGAAVLGGAGAAAGGASAAEGGGAAAGSAAAGGSAAGGLTAAEWAAGLSDAQIAGTAAGAGAAGAAGGAGSAGAGGGAVSEFGTLGSTGAIGPITGGGSTVAGSTGSGFLGLSTGDWVNLGTQLGGAVLQSNAAKSAAADQTAASNAAIAESRRQYDTTRADLAPWMQAGQAGLGRMRDLLGLGTSTLTPEQIMEQSPGYQFRLGQGEQAIDRAAGAQGLRRSGATLKALTRFGQDYASNEFGNIYNRLAGISGTGQQTGAQLGQFGAANANTIGGYMTGAANARGAAGIGVANAYGGALNNIGNYYSQNQTLDKLLRNRSGTGLYGSY